MTINKYRSIFISDVHLGTKSCKSSLLNNFLKNNTADTLYLVGDIIDGWKVQKNKWRWNKDQSNVVNRIIKLSSTGTKVIYIPGNHDEFLRPVLQYHIKLHGLELHNQFCHVGVDGRRYLVTHGDLFDGIVRMGKWLSFLGDSAYDMVLWVNTQFNAIRHRFGFHYWSLSKYLKHSVKRAVDFMFQFEQTIGEYCHRKGYDGVICGHIHHAEIKCVSAPDGDWHIEYMNDGDWVESCSALVEHHDGKFEIVYWTSIKNETPSINH